MPDTPRGITLLSDGLALMALERPEPLDENEAYFVSEAALALDRYASLLEALPKLERWGMASDYEDNWWITLQDDGNYLDRDEVLRCLDTAPERRARGPSDPGVGQDTSETRLADLEPSEGGVRGYSEATDTSTWTVQPPIVLEEPDET